jgi:16S rRNA (guanine527-N7)-methyltransferase
VKRDDARLRRLVALLASAPLNVSAVAAADAYERHVEDALAGAPLVAAAPAGDVVDVGSGGGIPGIPLALAFPERRVVLLEAAARRAAFLRGLVAALPVPNAEVVVARSEEHAAAAGREGYAVATARALAPPAVALELCLPLVAIGGVLVLYAGALDAATLAGVAVQLGGAVERAEHVPGTEQRQLVVVRKTAPTPARFPRRPGMAAKRPLTV